MIQTIRPYKLFDRLAGNRDVVYRIPHHRGTESETIMSLETLLLVAAIRMTGTKTILELGTCYGYNAFNLARNTDAFILTIDREVKPWVFDKSDGQITPYTMELDDVKPSHVDMVFCDINYTFETLSKATELAFACTPKVIAWHDYNHPLLPHVKPFLDEQPEPLIRIEDSSLVFWFSDDTLRKVILA